MLFVKGGCLRSELAVSILTQPVPARRPVLIMFLALSNPSEGPFARDREWERRLGRMFVAQRTAGLSVSPAPRDCTDLIPTGESHRKRGLAQQQLLEPT